MHRSAGPLIISTNTIAFITCKEKTCEKNFEWNHCREEARVALSKKKNANFCRNKTHLMNEIIGDDLLNELNYLLV